MSKIVQYDNLLVNFAYFGAFIEKKAREKGTGTAKISVGGLTTDTSVFCAFLQKEQDPNDK